MTYTPQDWADNDPTKPLSAARMNHLEAGVAAASGVNSWYDIETDGGGVPADATAAWNAAIASGEPTIYIPDGAWLINTATMNAVTAEGTIIRGAGRGRSRLIPKLPTAGGDFVRIQARRCKIADLSIGRTITDSDIITTRTNGTVTVTTGALPGTITVNSTTPFPASATGDAGTGSVALAGDNVTNPPVRFTYTGKTGTTFTGCVAIAASLGNDFTSWSGTIPTNTSVQFCPPAGALVALSGDIDQTVVEDVYLGHYYDGFRNIASSEWTLRGVYADDCYRSSVWHDDNAAHADLGDNYIEGGTRLKSSFAVVGIRWGIQGGGRITDTKVNSHIHGLVLGGGGGAGGTGNFFCSDYGFETQFGRNIILGRDANASYAAAADVFNHIVLGAGKALTSTLSPGGVLIDGGTSGGARDVLINGLQADNQANAAAIGIEVVNGKKRNIAAAVLTGYGTGVKITGGNQTNAVQVGTGVQFLSCPVWIDDAQGTTIVRSPVHKRAALTADTISDAVTYTPGLAIKMDANRSGELRLVINGRATAAANLALFRKLRVAVTWNQADTNCVVTSIEDNVAPVGGPQLDVSFDVTTTAGSVLVKFKRGTGGAAYTSFNGGVDVEFVGQCRQFSPTIASGPGTVGVV